MANLLAPMMLGGAAAVSVPIALHFFYKARYKPLPWAAMSFLKQAIEQTSRRLKFQEWILLALRCLLLILIALAFARPAADYASAAARGEAVDAVFLIDTSYSMGARDAEMTRLDRAKLAAAEILDQLPPRSTIQIYTCSDRATLLGPKARSNRDQARQIIQNITLSRQSTDFFPGFAETLVSWSTGNAPSREVYLFSDLQKSGFERQLGALRSKCEEIKEQGIPVFVRCSNPHIKPSNAAVVGITMPSDIPHTDTRVPFDVLIKNTGSTPLKKLSVSLHYRERAAEKDDIREQKVLESIEPGETLPVTLTGKLTLAGSRTITARLTGDELPGDNEFHRTILVREKVNVVVIDGSPDTRNPSEAGSHFLRHALAPVPESQKRDYYIQPVIYTADQASPRVLEGADVVYLLNVPSSNEARPGLPGLTSQFLEALNAFVRAGGGLVIACGDLVDADGYNKRLGSGGWGLLPFDLGEIAVTTEQYPYNPAPETIDEGSFLAPFRVKYHDVFKSPDIVWMYRVNETGAGSSGGRVLARASNQYPLIASREVDKGEVILVTTAFDTRWGNLPARAEIFVPLTRYTLMHLTGRAMNPDEFTNPDLRETANLEVAQDADVEGYLGFRPVIISAGAGADFEFGQHRVTQEYTKYILLLVFGVLLAEAGWAWYCGRAA